MVTLFLVKELDLKMELQMQIINDGLDMLQKQIINTKPDLKPKLEMTDFVIEGVGYKMVVVEGGTFEMGTAAEQKIRAFGLDSLPAHTVTLSHDFWLGATEVTQEAYEAMMGTNPSKFNTCGLDCPVENISWAHAAKYANAISKNEGLELCYDCQMNVVLGDNGVRSQEGCITRINPYDCAGYRLPTEAEWEYAARAGKEWSFSGSNDFDEVAWISENAGNKTHPVARKEPNSWGLYDMTGNVSEWTQDRYGAYSADATVDPDGPSQLDRRKGMTVRGGNFDKAEWIGRVSSRYWYGAAEQRSTVGFRLARTSTPAETKPDEEAAHVEPSNPPVPYGSGSFGSDRRTNRPSTRGSAIEANMAACVQLERNDGKLSNTFQIDVRVALQEDGTAKSIELIGGQGRNIQRLADCWRRVLGEANYEGNLYRNAETYERSFTFRSAGQ